MSFSPCGAASASYLVSLAVVGGIDVGAFGLRSERPGFLLRSLWCAAVAPSWSLFAPTSAQAESILHGASVGTKSTRPWHAEFCASCDLNDHVSRGHLDLAQLVVFVYSLWVSGTIVPSCGGPGRSASECFLPCDVSESR